MSSLQYSTPTGYATTLTTANGYNQAVTIPPNTPIVKLSGQGGWDPQSGHIPPPTDYECCAMQARQAFKNVDVVLRNAGSKNGWGDVYLVRLFLVDMEACDGAVFKTAVEEMKVWAPHRPVATAVEVKALALEGMRIEVEVEAVGAWDKGGTRELGD